MDTREILEQLQKEQITLDQGRSPAAQAALRGTGLCEVGYAPESTVGLCGSDLLPGGRQTHHLLSIFSHLYEADGEVFGTRQMSTSMPPIREKFPQVSYDDKSHIIKIEKRGQNAHWQHSGMHKGTADIPVAEEAAQTAEYFGSHVERIYDVGVSGIHRLFSQRDLIQSAIKVIAVAGMEGALASVLGGLVDKPVIAVPTSVGYGACMEGLSALLTMMTSCANGIAVVNIDNGYGAGYIANRSIIWQNRTEKRRHRMGKQLYFECASGISGDMAVAALDRSGGTGGTTARDTCDASNHGSI